METEIHELKTLLKKILSRPRHDPLRQLVLWLSAKATARVHSEAHITIHAQQVAIGGGVINNRMGDAA